MERTPIYDFFAEFLPIREAPRSPPNLRQINNSCCQEIYLVQEFTWKLKQQSKKNYKNFRSIQNSVSNQLFETKSFLHETSNTLCLGKIIKKLVTDILLNTTEVNTNHDVVQLQYTNYRRLNCNFLHFLKLTNRLPWKLYKIRNYHSYLSNHCICITHDLDS